MSTKHSFLAVSDVISSLHASESKHVSWLILFISFFFFFSSRRRHTRSYGDWSSDVCSSDLGAVLLQRARLHGDVLGKEPRHRHVALRIARVAIALGGQRFTGQHAAAER